MSFLDQLLKNKIMKTNILVLACLLLFSISSFSQKKTVHSKTIKYSDEQVLKYIDDYYSFYNANEEYCCPSIRKISNNVFYIKVEVCVKSVAYKDEDVYDGTTTDPVTGQLKMLTKRIRVKNDFFWHSKVLVLTIKSNDNYTVKEKPIY